MKRYVLAVVMALMLSSCGVGYYHHTSTIDVAGRVNISLQPSWGPLGYDYAMFYYFPDFDFYYDVERAIFYYKNYGRWVSAKRLPRGRKYPVDLHRFYKVVINQHNPWVYNRQHRSLYKRYKGVHTQPSLRDIREFRMPERRPEVSPRQGAQRERIRNSRNTNPQNPQYRRGNSQRNDNITHGNPPSRSGNSNNKGRAANNRSQGSRGR